MMLSCSFTALDWVDSNYNYVFIIITLLDLIVDDNGSVCKVHSKRSILTAFFAAPFRATY